MPAGIEVLLLRRAEREGDRQSGACVFPGGVLEAGDRALHDLCAGARRRRREPPPRPARGGLDYHVAAIRECFEECGLLFATDVNGRPVELDRLSADDLVALRDAAHDGAQGLRSLCDRLDLRLAVDRLAYLAHWLTPPGHPKRFDTRFFVAALPPGQTALHDDRETVETMWLRPAAALDEASPLKFVAGDAARAAVDRPLRHGARCVAHAMALTGIRRVMPRMGWIDGVSRPVLPGEPMYAEIGRIDPDGSGRPSARLVPGVAVRLSERVLRVTAGNAGVMTGPGTNTYLVGAGDDWTVIDPGPDDAAHAAAVLAAAPGRIRRILVTHTHKDHSPNAARLPPPPARRCSAAPRR